MNKQIRGELIIPASIVNQIVKKLIKKLQPMMNTKKQDTEALLEVGEVAEYLKVPVSWVYKRTAYKEIPHIKLANRQLRFRKKDIDKWLESLTMPAVEKYKGKI